MAADDDKNTRMLLKAVLEAENDTVFTAENGEDALSVMDANHIDLVVLNIRMPKMDGDSLNLIVPNFYRRIPCLIRLLGG